MRILFIGALNSRHAPKGGEEYKNQLLARRLALEYSCRVVDTHAWKKSPLLWWNLFTTLLFGTYDRIILSASSHSIYRIIQLLYFIPSKAKRSVYFVVGGYFPGALLKGTFNVKYYKVLNQVVVQGELLKAQLNKAGLAKNSVVIPNFKEFERVAPRSAPIDSVIRFVFVGRISEPKGVELIFQAVEILRDKGMHRPFEVYFYGPIDKAYAENFNARLNEQVQYRGYLDLMGDSKGSYAKLAEYHCMLFPTFWQGEGFPGVIIDAFIAGLPVIATDWNMNRELIQNGLNGFLLPEITAEALANCMEDILGNPDQLQQLSINARNEAGKYHIDRVWPRIKGIIEGN